MNDELQKLLDILADNINNGHYHAALNTTDKIRGVIESMEIANPVPMNIPKEEFRKHFDD